MMSALNSSLTPPDVPLLKRVSEEFNADIIGPPMAPRSR